MLKLLDLHRTNNRKVVGSRPTKVMCITALTGNRLGWTVRCGRPPLLLLSCRKLEFRLSALTDSDLAWVNGKSGRQSWCYADAFQRSIISRAIYHLPLHQTYLSSCFEAFRISVQQRLSLIVKQPPPAEKSPTERYSADYWSFVRSAQCVHSCWRHSLVEWRQMWTVMTWVQSQLLRTDTLL